MGWDKLREVIHQRQLEMGIIPPGTELSPRDPDVPAWDTLSEDEKRLYARFMEVFAGFSTHMDYHVGRLLAFLEELGELDNTFILFVSDNGASAEGGPTGSVNETLFFNMAPDDLQRNLAMLGELGGPLTYNHYPWGWTWAGNTPLRRWKRETYQGGMTDPFAVSWPAGIAARGEKRRQYVHAIDVVPTVLEVLGLATPESIRGVPQAPIEGISFAYTFANAGAPSRHLTQYYEMFGHRAIYHDGWKAVCPWPGPSFAEAGRGFGEELTAPDLARLEAMGWELYHVAVDFSESHNVAAAHPDKLSEMVARWWTEAGKYNVLPLDGRGQSRFAEPRPQIEAERTHYTYYPGGAAIPERQAAMVKNRAHKITAHVEIPAGGAEGVLLQQGGRFGGYAFGLKNHRLHYVHNYLGVARYVISSDRAVAPGAHTLAFAFEKTGEPDLRSGKGAAGIGRLYIDGEQVGEGEIPVTVPMTYALTGGGLTCGRSEGTPVIEGYAPPFAFTGTLKRVVVDVSGAPVHDLESEGRIAMAVQ